MNKCTAIALTTLGVVNLSYAGDGIYVGVGAGFAHFHGLNKIETVVSGAEDSAAANVFVGYNISDLLGAELGYVYAGRGNTDSNHFENQGGTLSLIGRVPVIGELSIFGEAGGYWSYADGLGVKDTKISSLLGAGFSYPVSDNFDVQARWRYMIDVSDLHSSLYKSRMRFDQITTNIEMVYHPFRDSMVVPPSEAPLVFVSPEMVEKAFKLDSEVLFEFGNAELKNHDMDELDKMYNQLVNLNPKDREAIVIGYSDRIGSKVINHEISKKRTEAVAGYLIEKGFPADRIKIEFRGAADSVTGGQCDKMIVKEDKIACLTPDRRVEIRIMGIILESQ